MRVSDLLSRRFASVDTTALRDHAACMHTLTPDEHPMLGAVEGFHHLYVGAGLSDMAIRWSRRSARRSQRRSSGSVQRTTSTG